MSMLLRNAETICGADGLVSVVSILKIDHEVLTFTSDRQSSRNMLAGRRGNISFDETTQQIGRYLE